ncbi:MAG: hypothetical protein LQ352_000090 [Teloschistes flavicans]|nr:MAG: hypothetical protein LQ352_000090 [Teloschistes flavicans]
MASNKINASPEADSTMSPPKTPLLGQSVDQPGECPPASRKKRMTADGKEEHMEFLQLATDTPVASSGVMQNNGLATSVLKQDQAHLDHLVAKADWSPKITSCIAHRFDPVMFPLPPSSLDDILLPNNVEAELAAFNNLVPIHAASPANRGRNVTIDLINSMRVPIILPTSCEQPSTRTEGQSVPQALDHTQANSELAGIHSHVSSQGPNRSDQIGLNTDPNSPSALALARPFQPPHGAAMTIRNKPDQGRTTNRSYQGGAPTSTRGRSRTRFHPSVGHAGIYRSYRSQPQSGDPVMVQIPALPRPHTTADSLSPEDLARFERRSCDELPQFWAWGTGVPSIFIDEDQDELTAHGGTMAPCRGSAHAGEMHCLCSRCRIQGMQRRTKCFTGLVDQDRFLGLCNECMESRVATFANPEDLDQDGKLVKFGCKCFKEWTCFDCTLNDMRVAKDKYDTQKLARRGITNVFEGEYAQIGDHCPCGAQLHGIEQAGQCSGCGGILMSPT